jgi:hypothetical protein
MLPTNPQVVALHTRGLLSPTPTPEAGPFPVVPTGGCHTPSTLFLFCAHFCNTELTVNSCLKEAIHLTVSGPSPDRLPALVGHWDQEQT